MIQKKKKPRLCYVSAPSGLDTSGLRLVLRALGVGVALEGETPPPGQSHLVTLRQTLRSTDFVCGVIGPGSVGGNVLFELGLAAGLGRPVFVVHSAVASVPLALADYPLVQADVTDVEALRFHLELFLRNVKRATRVSLEVPPRVQASRRALPSVEDLRERTRHVKQAPDSEVERIVLEAFDRTGIEAVLHPRYGRPGPQPDFAVWLPDAPPDLGNPIIIEVRGSLHHRSDVAEQVSRFLEASRARSALIISVAGDLGPPAENNGSYIFQLSLGEFLTAIERGTLVQRLIEQRNRLVHGGH